MKEFDWEIAREYTQFDWNVARRVCPTLLKLAHAFLFGTVSIYRYLYRIMVLPYGMIPLLSLLTTRRFVYDVVAPFSLISVCDNNNGASP